MNLAQIRRRTNLFIPWMAAVIKLWEPVFVLLEKIYVECHISLLLYGCRSSQEISESVFEHGVQCFCYLSVLFAQKQNLAVYLM